MLILASISFRCWYCMSLFIFENDWTSWLSTIDFSFACDMSLTRIWPLLLACFLLVYFLKLEHPFKKSVLPATLEFAQHKLQIITFSSASNKSQGNSSFHFGLNFRAVLAFSLLACFYRLGDFDNRPVEVSFVKLENSFVSSTLGLFDTLDPSWKPKSSRRPLFFDVVLLVPDGSLGLELFFPSSSLADVFPLSRLSVLPWMLFSWSGFSGWHFCLFCPMKYKGTKWFVVNHVPALLSRSPSLDD